LRYCGVRSAQEPEWTGRACCSKSFKLGSMFKLSGFNVGSNSVRTSGARASGKPWRASNPRRTKGKAHCTSRPRANDGICRSHARQAQTLRFFRRLRLLRPPPSSKPQRLLAATGPEPTLAADSVLGARHQLPDVVSMKGRLTHNHPGPRCEYQRARQQLHLPAPPPPESSTAQRQRRFSEAVSKLQPCTGTN